MKSVRASLVLWLIGSLALGSIGVLAGTYAQTRRQIGTLFDDELKQVALAVHLREEWIREGRVRIARPGFFLSVRAYDRSGHVYFKTALPSLPEELELAFDEGFVRVDTSEGAWRVYTHVTPEGIVQVGQPLATRDELARNLSLRVLMPILLLIPVLALVIGWALKRSLAPLEETSRRVSDRDASRLDPLPAGNVPDELLPLVSQINALIARVAASLEGQRRFLADAAHQLRSPVGALALQVQLASRAQSPEARATAMAELEHGIERARRLVQQLLDYARLEPGVPSEPEAAVDVARLARDVVAAFATRAEKRGVDLGADAPDAVEVRGSETELRSLIENLVDNALRYAPSGSPVTISTRRTQAAVVLTVVDSGPGIPAAERERAFERFHRVAGDTTPGTGLGLAIAKAIVERHHGTISLADARPHEERPGLAVHVRLPAPGPSAKGRFPSERDEARDRSRRRPGALRPENPAAP